MKLKHSQPSGIVDTFNREDGFKLFSAWRPVLSGNNNNGATLASRAVSEVYERKM